MELSSIKVTVWCLFVKIANYILVNLTKLGHLSQSCMSRQRKVRVYYASQTCTLVHWPLNESFKNKMRNKRSHYPLTPHHPLSFTHTLRITKLHRRMCRNLARETTCSIIKTRLHRQRRQCTLMLHMTS